MYGSSHEPETALTCEHCGHRLSVTRAPEKKSLLRNSLSLTILIQVALLLATVGGTLISRPRASAGAASVIKSGAVTNVRSDTAAPPSLADQIHPAGGYALPASYGEIGPQLLAASAIDYDLFVQAYQGAGKPLTAEQLAILREGSDAKIVFDNENAYFLLNFFWALGLANQNPLLEEGPLQEYSDGQVGRFASTGGWTIGQKPAAEFLSSASIIPLTPEQQARLEEVANAVYRPCCNNPTTFPDCNHGMAMLGLLELMAAQGATADEMFEAAKYVNAYWFPQQTLELAIAFKASEGLSFADVDPRQAVGPELFSESGFRALHQMLAESGLLQQTPNQGGSCGV